jgi:putative membrane-bound dehydrogenase-like protein
LIPIPAVGVRLAQGFQITQVADASIADDIQAMAIDARGRTVVTGPGYIRTLIDADGDGVAESSRLFATTATGGMGLCFDGPLLYFVGDGGLWRYADMNGDGVADGPPEKLFSVRYGEHGGHAIRQGPEGAWWLIAGNDGNIHQGLVTDPSSPVRIPQAGALVRFPPGFQSASVYAHGFRNPYDFDFNSLGDLFVYDSDVERDYLLPWYTPTRLYHVAYGGNHGWRLPGFMRSLAHPDYDPDIVSMTVSMGRGSPTGVVCYRHQQFTPHYHNGLFLLDWTFGRVWFAPLEPQDSSYRADPELFLEPIGEAGFAPTDGAVAPDGSLLLSIGGRKTRGAVYRITSTQDPARTVLASNWLQEVTTEVDAVVIAPQPLEAWSRAIWRPMAARFGARPFDLACGNEALPDSVRIRAIEVLTEMFGGLMTSTARATAGSSSPFVRARTAWSLGARPCTDFAPILARLAKDPSPHVRRSALEAISEQVENVSAALVDEAATANAIHPDKRLRQLSARLATFLPLPEWRTYFQTLARGSAQARLTCALAVAWRYPTNGVHLGVTGIALDALKTNPSASERLQSLGLLEMALGGWRLEDPSVELYSAYECAFPTDDNAPTFKAIRQSAGALVASRDPLVAREAARLLGMLRAPEADLPGKILAHITPQTLPSEDFHYLTVFSRLPSSRDTNHTSGCAAALIGLVRKLDGGQERPKQSWGDRFRELTGQLTRRAPGLPGLLVRHPGFVTPGAVALAEAFDLAGRQEAARAFLRGGVANRPEIWSPGLVRLIGTLPPREARSSLRAQWRRTDLRDELVLALSREPEPVDRDKFVSGLASFQPEVAHAGLRALGSLPPEATPAAIEGVLRLLQRSLREAKPAVEPSQILAVVNHLTRQSFVIRDTGGDLDQLRRACQPVFDWCAARYPNVAATIGSELRATAGWDKVVGSVPWARGNPSQGEQLFRLRGCANCHLGSTAIGPDLAGVTKRWSPQDLFAQIKYPAREIAEPYQAVQIQTHRGETLVGLVAFVSADGMILRLADGRTVRIGEQEIASRSPASQSIMPEGLLDGLSSSDLADLYAYLRTLGAP